MTPTHCWGAQFGAIQADCLDREMTRASQMADFHTRIADFLVRHEDKSSGTEAAGELDHGSRGWIEVTALDGYVLRLEWSLSELRSTFTAAERYG
jgi:hypothetical protein